MPEAPVSSVSQVDERLATECLVSLGAFHDDTGTLVLVGPNEPGGFWDHFQNSPEARDSKPHGLDRWSARVLTGVARQLDAQAIFPFGGPPYHPFFTWATKTGRVHESPVKLLVHDVAGLWVSFRGALRFGHHLDIPSPPPSPCISCEDKPCLTSCPADVLTGEGYDVPGCKTFLNSDAGAPCMAQGCRVRAACPVSVAWGRRDAQSAFHMRSFNPS